MILTLCLYYLLQIFFQLLFVWQRVYTIAFPIILFLNYILLIMLLQLSQISPFVPLHPESPTPSGSPHTIVHVHGHAHKFCGYSISYTVLYIPMAIL